jgi:iron(III) transport system ATP-binding protein
MILEVRELSVRYGDVTAVDRVSLSLADHGITALLGPSGCGKTSLLRAIAGFEVPACGAVSIGGRRVSGPACWVAPERRQVGMVFQEGALFPHLSVWDNVLYGVRGHDGAADRVRETLGLVGMEGLERRFPDQLSGGQQQRVALARALAPAPEIVLLDEPFANLDAGLRQRLRQEIRAILAAAGATAILVTHDQEEALSVSDSLAVMIDGRILQFGSPQEIYHRPVCLEVARFVGDGQFVECTVRAGRVRSALGVGAADSSDGQRLLLVRPEDLVLAGDGRAPLAGTLVRRRFFGHDLLEEVELEGGATLLVRRLVSNHFAVGSRVSVGLRLRELPMFRCGAGEQDLPPDLAFFSAGVP